MQVFITISNVGIMINADVNANKWLIKVYVNKEFIWNPSNRECECDKLCDDGEYLDYVNCKSRKRLVDKLVEECSEIVDEVKITEITSFEHKNNCKYSYTIYIILIVIIFTVYIGTGTYCAYCKYMNYSKKTVPKYDYVYQASNY